jgi:peptidoglycan/xylan/chitin deacetylase (PgdA/CDA1 family)
MYHRVGEPAACRADRFLNVSAHGFRRQMNALTALGYRARPFAEVVDALRGRHALPRRTFALTFDDGYRSIADVAAPILTEFRFPATVFVVSTGVGRTNAWEEGTGRPERPLMDWDALRGLLAAGWEIGGHTRTHPHLDALRDAAALSDIRLGKEETEARLGVTLRTFCYPFGHLNARTPALVRAAGFSGASTTRSGLARSDHDPFLLPRVKVAYRDGVSGMLFRLLLRPHLPDLRPHRQRSSAPLQAGDRETWRRAKRQLPT